MPGITLPPFPDDVPTVPLLVIDFELIKNGDVNEINRLWTAATELGFWYLKNHGAEEEADAMFETGAATMDLPLDEKMKFEQGDAGVSFGYKCAGGNAVDETGTPDAVEFINVSRDDALAWPATVHRTYPAPVEAHMDTAVRPFTLKSIEVSNVLLAALGDRLGLPDGTMAKAHKLDEHSGSETRCIKAAGGRELSPDKASLGAHTDFGSLSFLHNRLGGLQVFPPGSDGWKYVKPLPGHAICNLGDAMNIFSGGILRSNLHRVVPPPKEQAAYDRWSLVHFTRPGNSVVLEPMSAHSSMIAEAVAKAPAGKFNTGTTAGVWFSRRIQYQRLKNRTGPESWRASRGTEHQEVY
ncbi:Clavaminate synthase-like protein [Artomyces pyxidatus]|uniref:Clavaminate synthase-like protein n=1 Tax=Artomyces pyxidatus TaxID=48021 RepID=A0ACB8T195_9AGAM|nr:Clavaminate synthase-like protein [Artomyces pyxidatus]